MKKTTSKRRKERAQQRELAQDFSGLNLTPDGFHTFYTKFISLRFPMKIANVLELRYLINHTADRYKEPAATPNYRQFRESLQSALDSFGIENRRHSERMLKTLSMFRDIHYAHSIASRNAERRLREAMERNRDEYAKAVRYGLFFIFAGVSFIVMWLAMANPSLIVKLLPVAYAWLALRYFHKLPALEKEHEKLTLEVNDVLRRRVNSLNWKTLIHKIALVLGYKRVPGVEVFDPDVDHDQINRSAYH
ncbi:MAG: hypothetical protein NUV55_09605 [Sulfuricaulis sp.]|uniref:hypothetical protein n=1 Tax=Sulfuricaulis sp. TaxID=2003553 RepID=UPI0025D87CB8|nr:hypothetical protein [Sulfuricaulis sp.]MCR4347438.1 hypothetical protein [Sulfuricaulis sp.]